MYIDAQQNFKRDTTSGDQVIRLSHRTKKYALWVIKFFTHYHNYNGMETKYGEFVHWSLFKGLPVSFLITIITAICKTKMMHDITKMEILRLNLTTEKENNTFLYWFHNVKITNYRYCKALDKHPILNKCPPLNKQCPSSQPK